MNFSVPNSFELAKLQCNDNTSRALSFLLRRPEENLPLTECIYRVQGEILALRTDGVLLRNVLQGAALLSAESGEAAEALLEKLPENCPMLLVVCPEDFSPPTGSSRRQGLKLCRWPGFEPPTGRVGFEIWPLDLGDLPAALNCGVPQDRAESLSAAIARGQAFGACIQDRLAGTVGLNAFGGIDYLAVSPSLRRQGIGSALLRDMIRRELRAGHLAFALGPDTTFGEACGMARAGEPVLFAGSAHIR